MREYILRRIYQSPDVTLGAFGEAGSPPFIVTLELPWKDNAHKVSCIPDGRYNVIRYPSPKRGYDVPMLVGVKGRDSIEIHIGNTVEDTDGCILVGMQYGVRGIEQSVRAFNMLKEMLGDEPFILTVQTLR